jgi:hypothetical protein
MSAIAFRRSSCYEKAVLTEKEIGKSHTADYGENNPTPAETRIFVVKSVVNSPSV